VGIENTRGRKNRGRGVIAKGGGKRGFLKSKPVK